MKYLLALALLPGLAFASEECVAQLGGKCRPACAPGEKPEQGAFIDCAERDACCVPDEAAKKSSAAPPVVVIAGMAFSPEVTKVKVGTEVAWRNDDSSLHTVTAADGSFTSPPLDEGEVFRKVFTKPGTFSYTCEMHPFMSGKIVVQ
jgi:plastocyanin